MYSKLTNTIIELSENLSQPNRFYVSGEYDKYKSILDEYLTYNTNNMDEFSMKKRIIDIGCGDVKIPYYIIKSLDDDPYIMWINGDLSEINYAIKDRMLLKDAIENNQGTISFSARIADSMCFKRRAVNNKFIFDEEYTRSGINGKKGTIRTDYSIVEHLPYFYSEAEYDQHIIEPQSTYNFSLFWSYRSVCGSVWAYELEDGKYEIKEFDVDGRPEKSTIRTGTSLYEEYYNYMIENGYFLDNNQKMNGNHK